MHDSVIAVVFKSENYFLQVGYFNLLKLKHPKSVVIVFSMQQIKFLQGGVEQIYLVTDYIDYAASCICRDVDEGVIRIVDEGGAKLSFHNEINFQLRIGAAREVALQQRKCLYCKIINDISLSELALITTLNALSRSETKIKEKVMLHLNLDRKGYSRVMRKLLLRVGLRNEYALLKWARCLL
ncbi:TPA: hypothetical protein ACT912_001998 [Enterobacter hormaechei subsp. xiangfangensis]